MKQIEQLYAQWLLGKSLRAIARENGYRHHNQVYSLFKSHYGDHACNPIATSLARSVLADYVTTHKDGRVIQNKENGDLVKMALAMVETPEEVKHRSNHSLNMLGAFQVVHKPELMETIAVDPKGGWDAIEDPDLDFLRLPGFMVLAGALVALLQPEAALLAA